MGLGAFEPWCDADIANLGKFVAPAAFAKMQPVLLSDCRERAVSNRRNLASDVDLLARAAETLRLSPERADRYRAVVQRIAALAIAQFHHENKDTGYPQETVNVAEHFRVNLKNPAHDPTDVLSAVYEAIRCMWPVYKTSEQGTSKTRMRAPVDQA